MRAAVVECHAALIKAVQIGKGPPPFSMVGLTQQIHVLHQRPTLNGSDAPRREMPRRTT